MMFPFPKLVAKSAKQLKNTLEEAVAIPMDEGHGTDTLGPLCPIRVVDKANEVHQDLMENWLGLIAGVDGRNHHVHVNTKTGEVSGVSHGTDTCDGSLACGFLRIDNVHDILVGGSVFDSRLTIDEGLILLR
jgi:hypothetical protein